MSALPSLKQLQDAYLIEDGLADVANPAAELVAAEEAAIWDHDVTQDWDHSSTSPTYAEPAEPQRYPAAVRAALIASLAVAGWVVVLAAGYAAVKALR